jgi:hypothetical protein
MGDGMHDDGELAYYRRREVEELAAAKCSVDPIVVSVHLVFAERYADRVWSIEEASSKNRATA